MRGIFTICFAVVVSAVLSGCGAEDTGLGVQRGGILFINDWTQTVHVTIEGCEEFDLAPRGKGSDTHTAKCDFTENPIFTIHLEATWLLRESNPPEYRHDEEEVAAKSGDTVTIRTTFNEFTAEVQSGE